MSIQSCAGSQRAANEIIRAIDKIAEKDKDNEAVVKALQEVRAVAVEIDKSSESGWY
jgi:DNA polymerase/3'-5' exonuclease PolX